MRLKTVDFLLDLEYSTIFEIIKIKGGKSRRQLPARAGIFPHETVKAEFN